MCSGAITVPGHDFFSQVLLWKMKSVTFCLAHASPTITEHVTCDQVQDIIVLLTFINLVLNILAPKQSQMKKILATKF